MLPCDSSFAGVNRSSACPLPVLLPMNHRKAVRLHPSYTRAWISEVAQPLRIAPPSVVRPACKLHPLGSFAISREHIPRHVPRPIICTRFTVA
jgi:hypothetical protein